MLKTILAVFSLAILLLLLSIPRATESYVKVEPFPKQEKVEEIEKVVVVKKVKKVKRVAVRELTEVEKAEIERVFGENAEIATAVLKHESKFKLDAKNWNCHYTNEKGKRYSTSCKTIADRENAWSVDCGFGQTNVKGKECPAELMTFEGSMKVVEKKYKSQGLQAWSSFNNGGYLAFLK